MIKADPAGPRWRIFDIEAGAATTDAAISAEDGCFLVFWHAGFPYASRALAPGLRDETALRAPPPPERSIAPTPDATAGRRLTVVIPTRDRPDDLARCLQSFTLQTVPPAEIVVVDNASADARTRHAAVAAGAVYVREDRPGLDFARNAGIRAARGEIIAFCDDDVVLHPQWCARLLAAFDAPEIWAVTGLVLPLELETQAQRDFEFGWGFGRGFARRDFGPDFMSGRRDACPAWEVGAGASMAFRRSTFETVGLFDQRLDAGASGCSGDSEMWYRVLAEGGTCRYEPLAVSHHAHRRTQDGLRRQLRAYLRGHVVALLVQHQRYGHAANLRRAFLTLPAGFARRFARRVLGREDPYLGEEFLGWAEGLRYFLAHRRPAAPRLSASATAPSPSSATAPREA